MMLLIIRVALMNGKSNKFIIYMNIAKSFDNVLV